jgi:hypothetical protein
MITIAWPATLVTIDRHQTVYVDMAGDVSRSLKLKLRSITAAAVEICRPNFPSRSSRTADDQPDFSGTSTSSTLTSNRNCPEAGAIARKLLDLLSVPLSKLAFGRARLSEYDFSIIALMRSYHACPLTLAPCRADDAAAQRAKL